MPRLLIYLAACGLFVACSNSSSSPSGEGGRGGVAGTLGSGGEGGDGGTAAVGGFGGRGGAAGDGASGGRGGEAGTGGAAAAGGDGGAAGTGGAAAAGGRGGAAGTGGAAAAGGAAGAGGGDGENTCPVIDALTATPSIIPAEETQALVELEARDPDGGPDPVSVRLRATTGLFDDPEANSTTYTCGAPGSAELTARVTDGDPGCDVERTITVQCPNDIPVNLCPSLFTVNAIPSNIPSGQDSTDVETRADDPDTGPLTLVTTFYALYGAFDDPNAEDTVYRCERPGLQEICVDASDGACVKTLCTDVICPEE